MMKANSAARGRISVTMIALRMSASRTIEDDENEDRAFFEGLGDGFNRLLYEVGAVVERHELDTLGQCLLDRGQFLFHRVHHVAPAGPFEHQDDAGDGFALAVHGHGSLAQFRADFHFGKIAHIDRRVVRRFLFTRLFTAGSRAARGDDDILDVANVFDQADAAHHVLLGLVLDEVAAGVGVVLFQRLENLLQRDVERREPVGVHDDLVLLDQPAEGIYLGDARHGAKQRTHDVILDRPQFRRVDISGRC